MPRHPDPELEQRILDAACRLWGRGGEKSLTMRAVARHAGTTTPTVYERYRDRDDILRAVRIQTRRELYGKLSRTRTLSQACERYLEFALARSHSYEVLFDRIAQPPSLHEAWPSFNLFRQRLAQRLGGTPRQHTRLMLALWSLMHGTAMLIIRGRAEGALRTQWVRVCVDAFESVVASAAHSRGMRHSGAKWPENLILGEADYSKVNGADIPAGKRHIAKKPIGRLKVKEKRRH